MTAHPGSPTPVEAAYREHYGRAVSVLTRVVGDLGLAEDLVQEAYAEAVRRWPVDHPETGTPPSPAGWIITVARRRAIDRARRESTRDARHREAALLHAAPATDPATDPAPDDLPDDRLRLLFTCCHPSLAVTSQVALTLRTVGGLTTAEVARLLLVPEPTVGQRISRAKAKIRDARIPYRVPDADELPGRLGAVLGVVALLHTEAYAATAGDRLVRDDLAAEALRLARVLSELMPDEPEVTGLLALIVLTAARRPARTDGAGRLVPLADQDRTRWDAGLVAEGHRLVRGCLRRGRPGRYQVQAAIAAVHTDAPSVAETDWSQVVALYDQLAAYDPSPMVDLNRAVALAEVEGPRPALDVVEGLVDPRVRAHHLWHAVRADLLVRLGRPDEAVRAYDEGIARAANAVEADHLRARRARLDPDARHRP